MKKEYLEKVEKDLLIESNNIYRLQQHYGWTERQKQRVEDYGKFIAIDFLEWAAGRNLQVSLGVFVDNEGTYDNMEEYYGLYLQSKGKVV